MNELVSALNFDRIPDISLGTAALLIFGAIASLAVLKGLVRILWGSAVVCVAGYAAFVTWRDAPAMSRDLLGTESQLISWGLPVLVFLLAALLLRGVAKGIFSALRSPNAEAAEKNRRSPVRWAFTLLFSLIPTAALWFGGVTLLRHAGSVAEIQAFVEKHDLPDHTEFLARLKESVDTALPSSWFESVDPLTSDLRVRLAKLIAAADDPPPRAIPVFEESQIRDLILSDPELRALARQGRYSEILRDPRLDRLLENDNLREVLARADL
ncbi:hypothetical protein [Haloferula sargassicola]|uniref:CvpA family protein n=1 Tax=Haloferula sargassicola TaxID=490096 RepID=A0ABP9UPB4_9BACT